MVASPFLLAAVIGHTAYVLGDSHTFTVTQKLNSGESVLSSGDLSIVLDVGDSQIGKQFILVEK
jgi:hypothetical protein